LGDFHFPFSAGSLIICTPDRESRMIQVAYARHFEAARVVRLCAGQIDAPQPRLVLAFCGGKHAPDEVLAQLRSAWPDTPVVGGSAAGAIGYDGFGYSGLELIVAAFNDPDITPRALIETGLDNGDFAAGERLGRQVAAAARPGATVLLLFDSVAVPGQFQLHHASSIVEGFEAGLQGLPVQLIGGGLLTDMNLSDGWLFDGAQVRKHAAAALVFPSTVAASTVVLHGCRPVSTFMEITRIDGAEVFELDHEPALTVIERMLGTTLGGGEGHDLSLLATLGQKHGDPFAPYNEDDYVNRLILTSNRAQGSITLFEPDFRAGAKVQIMSRDNSLMLQSVRDGVARANAGIDPATALLNIYIDCAGRASARSGAHLEEAELVVKNLNRSVPLIGFYSGVEIAPFEGYSRPLDWTGVLATLRRN